MFGVSSPLYDARLDLLEDCRKRKATAKHSF
jgi:hypothetical protein